MGKSHRPRNKQNIDPNKKRRKYHEGKIHTRPKNYKGLLGEAASLRGIESEALVETILRNLQIRNIIMEYERSEHNSTLDVLGIDFCVWIEGATECLFIQVKSSDLAAMDFSEKYKTMNIFVVNGQDPLCELTIVKKIREMVKPESN
jgi:hypothetical protein